MRKQLTKTAFVLFTMLSLFATAQQKSKVLSPASKSGGVSPQAPVVFDEAAERQKALDKGIPAGDVDGYVTTLRREVAAKNAKLQQPAHNHNHNTNLDESDVITYNVNMAQKGGAPPTIQGVNCPNASFENSSFVNWTGDYGTVATGPVGGYPVYTAVPSSSITNTAGNNVSVMNITNYHTIMNIPPTNNVYPNCSQFGYDSLAVRAVGTNTVSDIPFVCPYFFDGVSCRMNSANANYRACRMKYNMALSPSNRSISYAFAVVLYDGGHTQPEQPYFKVSVKDQNGNLVGGTCGIYNVNATLAAGDTSFASSVVYGGAWYRKWRLYTVDLTSPIYASITSVTIEFEVGGCTQGGHWGYAYVDAECGAGGATSSLCNGANQAVLVAPPGYVSYQWITPTNTLVAAPAGKNDSLWVSPATPGQVYQVQMVTPTGCTVTLNDTIKITTVNILNIGSAPSCPGGASGSANVVATGSGSGYSYLWSKAATGGTVSTSQTATNLASGVYSVTVSSALCGSATTTVNVGVAAPQYYTMPAPFCGSYAWIGKPGGSNYKWYNSSATLPGTVIPAPIGTNDTLYITNPNAGDRYTLVYNSAQGCRDSILYTMTLIPGGTIYTKGFSVFCPGTSNGTAALYLSTPSTGPYNYWITGPNNYSQTLLNTTQLKDSISGIAAGTYTSVVNDGACIYTNTFVVEPTTFTIGATPSNTTICLGTSAQLGAQFLGNGAPAACGATTLTCSSPNQVTVGTGNTMNSNTWYPSVYSNVYKNSRHQLLFTAAELLAAGLQPGRISSISFMVSSILPIGTTAYTNYIGTLPGFTIKLKCTPSLALGSNFDNVGLTQVYNGNYSPALGLNVHSFQQNYEWDGVSNLLVDICYSFVSGSNYTSSPVMPMTGTGVNRCIYAYSNTAALCGASVFATTSTDRPNIVFGNCGAPNPASFNYSWSPAAGLNNATVQNPVASPTTTTQYTVTVSPKNNNCPQSSSALVNVVNPFSTAFTTKSPYCSNSPNDTLNATITPAPTGTVSYLWMNSTGNNAVINATQGIVKPSNYPTGGSPKVYVMINNGTCTKKDSVTLQINPYLDPTILGTSFGAFCETAPAFTVAAQTSGGQWYINGANANNSFDPSVAVKGAPGVNWLKYVTPGVCGGADSTQINVYAMPAITIAPMGPFCDNYAAQNFTLTSTPTATQVVIGTGVSNVGGTWQLNPANAVLGPNLIKYQVTNGLCVAKDSITVDIYKFTSAQLTGGLGPYCDYAPPVSLMSIAQNTVGTWTGTGVASSIFTPSVATPGSYTLKYYIDNTVPAGLCPDSSQVVIVVNPKPEVTPVSDIVDGCQALTVNFSTPSANTGTAVWDYGDGSTPGTGMSSTYTYTANGTYTVTLYYADVNGCLDTTVMTSPVVVYKRPVANFDASPNETTVVDAQVVFTNQTSDLNNNSYNWTISTYTTTTEQSPTYLFTEAGTFDVTLVATSPEGCTDTVMKQVVIKPDVVMYVPNAFTPGNNDGLNDDFFVVLPQTGVDETSFKMQVYDRWGQVIYQTSELIPGTTSGVLVSKPWTGAVNNAGEIVKQDTYVWKVKFQDTNKKWYERVGHITIAR